MPRFGSGTCVHCGHYSEELTADHILPNSWYPDSTPAGLEKWQAPACSDCNAEYGRLERGLFQQLALGVDPWVVGGEGVGERAARSYDPRVANNEKDRQHREAGREKLRRRIREFDSASLKTPILPNIGTLPSPQNGSYSGEYVDWSDLQCLLAKFVRGITYVATGEVLPREYIVRIIRPNVYSRIPDELLNTSLALFERGPGFRVERHAAADDPYAAFFRILLWGKYEFFAAVLNRKIQGSANTSGG
jgi:hypothetical protein